MHTALMSLDLLYMLGIYTVFSVLEWLQYLFGNCLSLLDYLGTVPGVFLCEEEPFSEADALWEALVLWLCQLQPLASTTHIMHVSGSVRIFPWCPCEMLWAKMQDKLFILLKLEEDSMNLRDI